MANIFLSYSHRDAEPAGRLAEALQGEGWSVFWDRAIPGGQTWRQVLSAELRSAGCVVVLWSDSSVESSWVLEEADFGLSAGRLVPVLLDTAPLPLGFRQVQARSLVEWNGRPEHRDFRALRSDIAARLEVEMPAGPNDRARAPPAAGRDMRLGSGAAAETSPRPPRLRFLAAALAVVLLAGALAYLPARLERAADGEAPPPERHSAVEPSVAVLPFVNVSNDPGQEYFSDGLTDTILGRLSQLKGLKVAARTSAYRFKGKHEDVREIGRQLAVRNVVEGSVQRASNKVRVIARLIRTTDGTQLWSHQFDTQLKDIFEIQDEISSSIAKSLKVTLLRDDTLQRGRPTSSIEAYNSYLLGRHHLHKRTASSLRQAVRFFEEAIDGDPEFALAYSALADAYLFINEYTHPSEAAILTNLDAASAAVARALSLDDDLAEAHASLGLLMDYDADDRAEAHFRRALELNPNYVITHLWYGDYLRSRGRLAEALTSYSHLLELDRLSYIAHFRVGEIQRLLGNFELAASHLERSIELEPEFPVSYFRLAATEWSRGRLAETHHWLREGIRRAPEAVEALANFAILSIELGDFAAAEALVARATALEEDQPRLLHAHSILYVSQGRYEASRQLGRAMMHRYPQSRAAMLVTAASELLLGNADQAIELYDLANLRLEPTQEAKFSEPGALTFSLMHALIRAKAYWQTGLASGAAHLMRRTETFLEQGVGEYHLVGTDYFRAALHALRGDVDAAESALRRAIAAGWRRTWELEHNPVFASLIGTPAAERLRRRLDALNETDRAKITLAATTSTAQSN